MGVGGGTKSQREIWLPRESEPRRLQVFTRPGQEEEEARVQIRAGAGRGCGLSTTVSLGQDPGVARGKGGAGRADQNWPALPRRGQPWASGSPCWTPNLPEGRSQLGGVA